MARITDANLAKLVTLLTSLTQELNDLRDDFLGHDHGGTYTPIESTATLRVNTLANTLTAGTYASAEVSDAVPSSWYAVP